MIAVLALNIAITIAALALVDRHVRRTDRNGVGKLAHRDISPDEQAWGDTPLVPHALQVRFHTVINNEVAG